MTLLLTLTLVMIKNNSYIRGYRKKCKCLLALHHGIVLDIITMHDKHVHFDVTFY